MKNKKAAPKVAQDKVSEYKQMILKVDKSCHEWLQTIAQHTDLAMPKIVDLVLGDAIKKEPKAYIDQINKLNAKEALRELEEKAKAIDNERKRLSDLLQS